jgi:4-hydroxy-3-polyprenylbenzoate decarboxylase
MERHRIIVGVSGASGVLYARRLLSALADAEDFEVHLVISRPARRVLAEETDLAPADLERLACASYEPEDIAAAPASGSFQARAMAVCPCSMATLGAISRGAGTNLIHRAADVALKERRPLALVCRETPLGLTHLENMRLAHMAGATILPACPAFYHRPRTLEDLADHMAGKVLDLLDIPHNLYPRWSGGQGDGPCNTD